MKRVPWRGPPRAETTRTAADAIAAALRFRGITDEVRARRVLTEWSELVGPKIASRTRPDGIFERVLVVEVASSAWLHELNLLRQQILSGLLARLGEPRLFDDLKLKLAGRSRTPRPTAPPRRPQEKPVRAPVKAATGAAREQIAREVQRVDDDELRELIARVRIANDC